MLINRVFLGPGSIICVYSSQAFSYAKQLCIVLFSCRVKA